MKFFNKELTPSLAWKLEIGFIIAVACFPLLFNLPFRDNIYLSYEGAYRMYKGQMPFVDFGLPMGYGFWLFPALSFKIFGPFMHSLVKIQVLINILSGLAFLTILKGFTKDRGLITVSVFLYVISFSFFNFWPWYNHTVIVFEFIGLALLLIVLKSDQPHKRWQSIALLSGSALFIFLSLFTKQDGGAFAVMLAGVLLLYYTIVTRKFIPILAFAGAFLVIAFAIILPLVPHEFGYWFNYGQEPHYSRVNLLDLLSVILGDSKFIKFYFLVIVVIFIAKSKEGFKWLLDKKEGLHLLLALGILFQASILQVTSYVPADGNIYFHSFMFFYILSNINFGINFSVVKHMIPMVMLIFIWWSGVYWKYSSRIFYKFLAPKNPEKNVVSITTYTNPSDTTVLDKSNWGISPEKPFDRIKLPQEAIQAIEKLKDWKQGYAVKDPKILNMSEMTPLAEVLDYELETDMPLWYHLNVAMFDRELNKIEGRIKNDYYDLVIFEVIPQLNNFYPFSTREVLADNYELLFKFQAPREYTTEFIEVYVKKNEDDQAIKLD